MQNRNQKTILVIEDEGAMLRLVSDALQQAKFNVLQADNGVSGLQTAFSEHPDLVVLDLVLPQLDGMSVMRKLREDSWGSAVPIIILTNLVANERIMKGVTHDHPAYYLVKTATSMDELVEKVNNTLGL